MWYVYSLTGNKPVSEGFTNAAAALAVRDSAMRCVAASGGYYAPVQLSVRWIGGLS